MGLWSCSSEEPIPGGGVNGSKGDVYANLTLSIPSTRSETVNPGDNPSQSNNGFEYGQDDENNVDQVLIVLASNANGETAGANPDYKFITSSLSNSILDQSKNKPTYTVAFESDKLTDYADKLVYVFAYCNPDATLVAQFNNLAAGDSFTDLTGKVLSTDAAIPGIATSKKFLMTNALPAAKTLPSRDNMVKVHNTTATAFDLGTVSVERVACRFDFQSTTVEGQDEANLYPINDMVSGKEVAMIEINGMSLFNEAVEYYYLPRVSDNGLNNGAIISGRETPSNWVVSPLASEKSTFIPNVIATSTLTPALSQNYFAQLSVNPANMTYTDISSLSQNDNDGWTGSAGTSYKIWRYATENTQPAVATQTQGNYKQVNLLTTGVMFRGEIKKSTANTTAAKTIAAAMTAGQTLYAYSQEAADDINANRTTIMLGSAMDVWKYADTHNTSSIRTEFIAAVRSGYFKLYSDEDATQQITVDDGADAATAEAVIFGDNVKAVAGSTSNTGDYNHFVAYTPTNGHYYVYYPYYNRHNDNDNPALMGIMEFATVRNNVYKLAVENVVQFGLPGDVPPPPNDDEDPEVFFKVSVQVLDWVVRVNNIIL